MTVGKSQFNTFSCFSASFVIIQTPQEQNIEDDFKQNTAAKKKKQKQKQ